MFDFMPVQASSWAAEVDWVNNFITDNAVFFTVAITATMLFFCFRYRRKSNDQTTPFITHSVPLETLWTIVPTIIVIFTFYIGYSSYKEMRTPPSNTLDINVDAFSWRWEFEHPNGKKSTDELVVPVGRPIRLIMTSHDVLHSFYVPAMRVKEDVRGGVYSYLWFTPIKLGNYHIFCAEYCGFDHSGMTGTLRVVPEEEYQSYIYNRGMEELPPAERGKKVFTEKACGACHSTDGTVILGPSLKGLFANGKREFEDGTGVSVDENYVRESLLTPQAKIVRGFAGKFMPSFEGQLTEEQLSSLITYLKTL